MANIRMEDLPQEIQDQLKGDRVERRKKRSKYNADRTMVDGINFDSRKEATYYSTLDLMQRAGEIQWFLMQVPFRLPGNITYRLDFMVMKNDGTFDLIDVKGMKTKEYMIKKKQVEALYGVEIREV
jgi:hypothetical protein